MDNPYFFSSLNFAEEQDYEPVTPTPTRGQYPHSRGRGGSPRRNVTRKTPLSNKLSTSGRKKPRSVQQKIEAVLTSIKTDVRWSLGEFLHHLFSDETEFTSNSRTQAVSKFLSGQTEHSPLSIIQLIYNNPHSYPKPGYFEREDMFSAKKVSSEIFYAKPAISTWALEQVVGCTIKESNKLISRAAGLRVRATSSIANDGTGVDSGAGANDGEPSGHVEDEVYIELLNDEAEADNDWQDIEDEDRDSNDIPLSASQHYPEDPLASSSRARDSSLSPTPNKRRRIRHDPTVSWDVIGNFSLKKLEKTLKKYAPVSWHIMMKFMDTNEDSDAKYRPKHIVSYSKLFV